MTCKHCGREHNLRGKRGLCWVCYYAPGVRYLYPTQMNGKSKPKPGDQPAHDSDPTEEELDRMIAEQLPSMPPKGRDE